MQRYPVTVVAPGSNPAARPTLLVPFRPTATVKAFLNELFKRIARQNIQLAVDTHLCTLHIDSETGALVDVEDVLEDVVPDPKNDKLFAVFAEKTDASTRQGVPEQVTSTTAVEGKTKDGNTKGGETISVRVITPALAKDTAAGSTFRIPVKATIRDLHTLVANHLQLQPNFEEDADQFECNCKLANQLADGPAGTAAFLVVHIKSVVERLRLSSPSEHALKQALREKFGDNLESTKRVHLVGADVDTDVPTLYKKAPVAVICSKQRHTPAQARVHVDETGHRTSKVLDLHTSELPIHPACMSSTIKESGISALAVNGIVDIFAVNRTTTGANAAAIGKSSIFRSRAHWEPSVTQSDRGIAMFLSSLRVFVSLVEDMSDEERAQDAILHVFDLLAKFPPALRALHILVQGKTPSVVESAALSQAVFEILDEFMPTDIVGHDHSRVFEGSRLLFGFVLEKAKGLKLPNDEGAVMPYLSAFRTVELRDRITNEAVMHAVQTSNGMTEGSLFESFQEGGLLVDSHLQSYSVKMEVDSDKARQALLSCGRDAEVTIFSSSFLTNNYRYADAGNVKAAINLDELWELGHLAELCGRNELAVHRPSQLSSAVAPRLTFDRNAHLAVYTGEQGCAAPGQSSLLFRPMHGEAVINATVIEQLIAPSIRGYEADGTAVFDALGGAAVKRLQTPDEVLMFCVDTSASMRQETDFPEINGDEDESELSEESGAQGIVEAEFFNRASFEDMKESLCAQEGFEDMIAILSESRVRDKRPTATRIVEILRNMLSSEIVKDAKNLEARRQYVGNLYHRRQEITQLENALSSLKTFWAGLKTHEDAVCDFLMYRATTTSSDLNKHWTWSFNDPVPAVSPPQQIPTLDADITELSHNIRCPISHKLMEDAVVASDGHTYSHAAIQQWFSIRSSSPMTGLGLDNINLESNSEICDAAERWASGLDILGTYGGQTRQSAFSNNLNVTFESKFGSFERSILPSMSIQDLYKLAFRGLKGRFTTFQLSTTGYGALVPSHQTTVLSRAIGNGERITIRIADVEPTTLSSGNADPTRSNLALIKVYGAGDNLLFAYWVHKDTTATLASVLWKYCRHKFREYGSLFVSAMQVWTDMEDSGDGLLTGYPRESSDQLSTYLNRLHCFGTLGTEKVYREGPGNSGADDPLVLKVKINPFREPEEENRGLTRLDVLKQTFEALINRVIAYNYKTHVGLITFASTPQVATPISHVIENFRRATNGMTDEGDTTLWDALALAKDQIQEYCKKYPDARKRIICISDGADTNSANTGPEMSWQLRQAHIAIDTICLGDDNHSELLACSKVNGCYAFHPDSLINALAICEMEPFLSLSERPTIEPPVKKLKHLLTFKTYFGKFKSTVEPTRVTERSIPPRKEHPNLHDEFVELTAIASRPVSAVSGNGTARANLRSSRLMNEINQIANGEHPTYDVYVSESDMSFWKVVMSGPEGSPYEDGMFLMYLHADEGYPTFAPKVRFITKMKHPNVNAHGRICHSILDRDWTSDTSISTILDTVFGLLLQPEYSDPVNTTSTLGFHHDQVEFEEEVREHVKQSACSTRAQLRSDILGEFPDEEASDENGYEPSSTEVNENEDGFVDNDEGDETE